MINEFLNNFNSHIPNWSSDGSDLVTDFLLHAMDIVPPEVLVCLFLTIVVLILSNIYNLIIKI